MCPGKTQKNIATLFQYIISATHSTSNFVQIVKELDFISYTSCVPSSYLLVDGTTAAAYSLGTGMTLDLSANLKVDTMVSQKHYIKLKY